ncbi:MAG TPA: glycosyltransferase, partial [Blastocatellia bacterium]|nr:glycosyltransferase [Blastocatellia bacterium]
AMTSSESQRSHRSIRAALRAVTPYRIRRLLLNIVRPREFAEKPVTHLSFDPQLDYDVVCYPIIDWNYLFQRPQQLATKFAATNHRVFYFHTTFHQSGASAFARQPADRINIVRLPGSRKVEALYQNQMSEPAIERCLEAIATLRSHALMDKAVSLVQFPAWAQVALRARERWGWKVVYDCMDEHSGFSQSPAFLDEFEGRLLRQSDLVTASSHALYEKASKLSTRVIALPNAADFEHFSRGDSNPLADIPRPVIGYYGAISDWLDVDMIRDAAIARPKWQFVFVGDSFGVDLSHLERLSNVHFTGRKPYAELPAYLHRFDVAVIPFRLTPLTLATNPVKFYEYLSAGKPVVAVDLPELQPYREYFYPVHAPADFVPRLEDALAESSAERVQARIEFARRNDWSERYEVLNSAIRGLTR